MPQAAVIGSPVAHSLSPVLHRAAYEALGLANWRYTAVDLTVGELTAFLAQVRSPHWAGLSVTMPHKKAIVAGARSVCTQTARLGVANTVIAQADGYWVANTDVAGLAAALRRADPHLPDPEDVPEDDLGRPAASDNPENVPGRPASPRGGGTSTGCGAPEGGAPEGGALIVGSGATARSAIAAAAAVGVPYVGVTARSEAALAALQRLAGQYGLVAYAVPWQAKDARHNGTAWGPAAHTPAAQQEPPRGDHTPGAAQSPPGGSSPNEPDADTSGALGVNAAASAMASPAGVGAWRYVVSTVPAQASAQWWQRVATEPGHPCHAAITGGSLVVLDVVYGQGVSQLSAQAAVAGHKVASALDVLVYQAADQVRLMTGHLVDASVLGAALAGGRRRLTL